MILAGDGRSVSARVRAARRWLLTARLAEGAVLAAAAFLGVMATALSGSAATALSGSAATGARALCVAGLGALLAGAAHVWSGRESSARVARRLDAALELDGALVTAFEVEGEESPNALASLLPRRVAARVSARRATRTLLPRSMPLVVLPFLAGALLFLALDLRHRRDPRRDLEAHAERLFSSGGRLRASLGGREQGLTELEQELVQDLAEQAAALGLDRKAAASEPERTRERLEELRGGAAELGAELPAESGARQALRELEAEAEAALRALGGDSDAPNRTPVAAANRPDGSAAPTGPEPATAGAGEAAGGSGLTPDEPEGTMSDRPADAELPGSATVRAPAPGAGVAGQRPLPVAHARIVRGWIQGRAQRVLPPETD